MCLIRCVRFLLPQVESKYRCDLIIQSCLDPMYKKKKNLLRNNLFQWHKNNNYIQAILLNNVCVHLLLRSRAETFAEKAAV